MAAPIVVMLGIFFVPESPRWTYLHKGKEEAERVLKRLRQTDNVGHELEVIGDQVAEELAAQKGLVELLEPSIFKRVAIAMMLQLLLIGAVGMVIGHLFAAILFTAICNGNVDNAGCPKVGGWFICVGSAFFVFNFAISWGPVCWIYPAEIFPLGVRAPAVALSTAANWAMGAVMTEVVKLFPHLNINGVFFLFAGLCCICGVFVYFFCPETKGIMLEDIEALSHSGQQPKSPAFVEIKSPQASLA
ncbi:Sugar transport protein 10 [Phytophthora cinnamomi]|uniref:Sugar transport protein 10 n=1 Tax=Phytophthora cinnamomi TaxID=4785 RepID=UPI00355A1C4F|nr:Sugar transport protein 10 [Phytophthora cinnamomi]